MKNSSNNRNMKSTGEMSYDKSPRIDHKRGHRFFLDNSDQYSKKKVPAESSHKTQTLAPTVSSGSLMIGGSSSRSGNQIQKDSSNALVSINTEKTGSNTRDSIISLNMAQAAADPQLCNTGLRKVKVREVTVREENSPELVANRFSFPVYGNNNVMGTNFPRFGQNFARPGLPHNSPFGPSSSKSNDNFMMNNLSIGHYRQEASFMSTGCFYSKGRDSFFAVDPIYGRTNETFWASGFGQDDDDDVVIPYSDDTPDVPSLVENYDKGEPSQTLPFAGFPFADDDDAVIPYSSMEESGEKLSKGPKDENAKIAKNGAKKSEFKAKKEASGIFPSNVKSLLATGIFDGVPVKYVSWTREKTLRGVIKGSGYLCSCGACELSKAVNAFEFQRHAGGKTKHPNNHIYFENGKTVYALVLELRATPPDSLFEVIQNATGSGVHEQNFATWKESYRAATRECQLRDGVAEPS